MNIKVHLIKPADRSNERDVGIELSQSAILAWSMTPITLTAQEASQLMGLLDAALSGQSTAKQFDADIGNHGS